MTSGSENSSATTFWTIGRKLILASSAFILAAVALTTVTSTLSSSELARSVFFESAKRVSALVAKGASGAVKFKKADGLVAEFDATAAAQGSDFVAAGAFAVDGAPIANVGSFSADVSALVAEVVETESAAAGFDRHVFAEPVRFGKNDSFVGVIVIEWDDSALIQRVFDAAQWTLAIGLLAVFAAAAILAVLLRNVLTRPIGSLTETIVRLLNGEKVEIDGVRRSDEIGSLARSVSTIYANGVAAARLRRAVDCANSMMMLADENGEIVFVNAPLASYFDDVEQDLREISPAFEAQSVLGSSFDVFHKNPDVQRRMVEELTGTHRANVAFGERKVTLAVSPVFGEDGERLGVVVEWRDVTQELRASDEIDAVVSAAVRGDFSRRADMTGAPEQLAAIGERLNTVTASVEQGVAEVRRVVGAIDDGDLSEKMDGDFQGAFADLQIKLNGTVERLSKLMAEIASTTTVVQKNATMITSGAEDLASRAEQQASSLEETAATMEEMAASIKSNADSSSSASSLAAEASDRAEDGGGIVKNAVQAMGEIEDSASKIADIISVIDGIAFQTNLLALNAAVEAARAGDAGKGFAVVASEVRALAQRSSDASRDIRELIETSAGQVSEGVRLVTETGSSLGRIVDAISQVDEAIKRIADASVEQASSVEEMSSAVSHMDEMTQKNATLAEQSASSARTLADSSSRLRELVAFFDVGLSSPEVGVASHADAPAAAGGEEATDAAWRSVETDRAAPPKAPALAAAGADRSGDWSEF